MVPNNRGKGSYNMPENNKRGMPDVESSTGSSCCCGGSADSKVDESVKEDVSGE